MHVPVQANLRVDLNPLSWCLMLKRSDMALFSAAAPPFSAAWQASSTVVYFLPANFNSLHAVQIGGFTARLEATKKNDRIHWDIRYRCGQCSPIFRLCVCMGVKITNHAVYALGIADWLTCARAFILFFAEMGCPSYLRWVMSCESVTSCY